MSFDPKCLELAEHFLPDDFDQPMKDALAQHIQEAVEDWLDIMHDESPISAGDAR